MGQFGGAVMHSRMAAKAMLFVVSLMTVAALGHRLAIAADQPTATVTPGTLSLIPGQSADVLITLTNPTDKPLTDASLTALPTAGAALMIGDEDPGTAVRAPDVAPGRHEVVAAVVKREAGNLPPGPLVVRFDYVTGGSGDVTTAMVQVADATRIAAQPPVEVTTETALTDIDEVRSGIVYLVIKNLESSEVSVCDVTLEKPDGVTLEPAQTGSCQAPLKALASGDTLKLKYTLRVKGQVAPGKAVVLFDVHVAKDPASANSSVQTHVVKSLAFTAGIFGESGLLAALDVPSFLLLPGFLLLVSFRLVGRLAHANLDRAPFPWETVKSAEFALLAITLSIAAAPTYPIATDWFGESRGYLASHGIRDLLYVWGGSITIGVVAAIFAAAGVHAYRWRQRRRVPTTDLDPAAFLDFLARNNVSLLRPQVRASGTNEMLYLIRGDAQQGDFWAAPAIRCAVRAGTIPEVKGAINKLIEAEAARPLASKLKALVKNGTITMTYESQQATGPRAFTAGAAGAPIPTGDSGYLARVPT
jgi:hypothetical protein